MEWKQTRSLRPGDEILAKLKRPIGQLILGGPGETMPKLKEIIAEENPPIVVTVGDVVSLAAETHGVRTDLRIVDRKTLRKDYDSASSLLKSNEGFERVQNPAGSITSEAWEMIKQTVASSRVRSPKGARKGKTIVVDGEEDLLALPAIAESPLNSLVVYGQPSEGLVVVRVTKPVKSSVDQLIQKMVRE